MIKIKYIFVAVLFSALFFSCDDNDKIKTIPFDHLTQAIIDNESIVKFLKNHYYNTESDLVEKLKSGKTALFSDPNLNVKEVQENGVDYKLYVYVKNQGTTTVSPSVVDSVFVNYSGFKITDSKLGESFDKSQLSWTRLSPYIKKYDKDNRTYYLGFGVVKGWTYGFSYFRGGTNVTKLNEKITYKDYGKGVLFIPSGLGYRNLGSPGSLAPNQNLLFYIDLLASKEADYDYDGISSLNEDITGTGKPWNVDTDNDGFPNYLDDDDDGDGTLTKYEDENKDGDPRNDFNDTDNPNVPDYLNQNIR